MLQKILKKASWPLLTGLLSFISGLKPSKDQLVERSNNLKGDDQNI